MDAADAAGLSGQSRVYDLFVTLEAVTPQEYKERGTGIAIDYGFHKTPFGEAIIGVTERGVCHLSFLAEGDRNHAIAGLEMAWENASLKHNDSATEKTISTIFHPVPSRDQKLNVLVKGTNFLQLRDAGAVPHVAEQRPRLQT